MLSLIGINPVFGLVSHTSGSALQQLFAGCVVGGVLFAAVTFLFDDLIGNALDGLFPGFDHLDFLNPMVIVGGITVFGGAGLMLSRYTGLDPGQVVACSLLMAVLVSFLVYFLYVRPMRNAENSTIFSVQDLIGKIGEVTVTVPPTGCGEIMLRVGAGNTNQIAASLDGQGLAAGTRVVVSEILDGVLYVFPYDDEQL